MKNLIPTIHNGWRIALREMRGGLHGFRIFLLCLLPGVIAIGGIGTFSAAVRAGLWEDARAMLGGDVEVRLMHRGISQDERTYFEDLGEISQVVQLRGMPYHAEADVRALAEVKAVDHAYPLYGEVRLEPAIALSSALEKNTEGVWGAVAEPGLKERLSLSVGDRVTLGDVELEIRARLVEEPDRSLAGFTFGPRFMMDKGALEQSGLLGDESLASYLLRIALPEEADAEETARSIEAAYPDAGWRVHNWQEAEPRIRDFLERMTFNLTLIGLCALLSGGVGVHGAVRGYLTGKLHHIATLKCMGASGGVVFTSYLLQIGTLALLAVAIGSAIAAAVPWFANIVIGHLLPVRVGLYWLPLGTASVFGILIALLFSLHAIGVARNVPPSALFRGYTLNGSWKCGRDILLFILVILMLLVGFAFYVSAEPRLTAWFLVGAIVVFLIFRFFTSFIVYSARALPRPVRGSLRMAMASIQRPGSPAGAIVFALGVGLTTLVVITHVQTNLNRFVLDTLPKDAPAFFVMDIQGNQIDQFLEDANHYAGVERVDTSPILRGRITSLAGVPVSEATIDPSVRWAVRGDRFMTYREDVPDGNEIVKGTWWDENSEPGNRVSITADLGKGLGLEPGEELEVHVMGRRIQATVTNWREVDWSSLQMNFALVFHPDVLSAAPASWLASIHGDEASEGELFREITSSYPDATVIGTRDILSQASRTINRIGMAFRAVGAVSLLAGFLVLAGAVTADQQRRIREAVIAKVCGATRGDLIRALLAEFALLGLAGLTLSYLVGSLAAYGIIRGLMEMAYSPDHPAVALVLLPGVIGVVLVGVIGTWHVLGQRPARHLREE